MSVGRAQGAPTTHPVRVLKCPGRFCLFSTLTEYMILRGRKLCNELMWMPNLCGRSSPIDSAAKAVVRAGRLAFSVACPRHQNRGQSRQSPINRFPIAPDAAVTESRRRSVEEKLLRRRWRPRARGGGRPGAARRDSLLEHPETPRIDQKTARKVPEMMPKTLSGSR